MTRRKWLALTCVVLLALGSVSLILGVAASAAKSTARLAQGTIEGVVVDEWGESVAAATVRIQATTNSVLSGSDGAFSLSGLSEGISVTVSAWKDHYYCAKVEGWRRLPAGSS